MQSRRVIDPQKPTRKILGQEDVQQWLFAFQKAVQKADFKSGRALFHKAVVAFETRLNRADDLDALNSGQWHKQWPSEEKFGFLFKEAKVIPVLGAFIIAIEWIVPSNIIGGHPRMGRSTFVLLGFEGKLLCVHVHASPSP
jgi:hypothetical protein